MQYRQYHFPKKWGQEKQNKHVIIIRSCQNHLGEENNFHPIFTKHQRIWEKQFKVKEARKLHFFTLIPYNSLDQKWVLLTDSVICKVCEHEYMPICSTTYEQECSHSYEHGKQCVQKPQETCTNKAVSTHSVQLHTYPRLLSGWKMQPSPLWSMWKPLWGKVCENT